VVNEDVNLTSILTDEGGVTIEEASWLLGVTTQHVSTLDIPRVGTKRGSPLRRQPVLELHIQRLRELEQQLERMRLAARQLGVRYPPPTSGPTPALDLTARLERTEQDLNRAMIDQGLAQKEIDRLKGEVRDANNMIDGLLETLRRAKPREDIGLDDVPTR